MSGVPSRRSKSPKGAVLADETVHDPVPHIPSGDVRRPLVMPPPEFGVRVFESRHGPGFRGELQDAFSKYFLVLAGEAVWETEQSRVHLTADSFVHVPAGLRHRQMDVAGNAVTLYAVHYEPGLLLGPVHARLEEAGLQHWPGARAQSGVTQFLRACFQEMLYEQHLQREGWETVLQGKLLALAARSVRMLARREENAPVSETGWGVAERVANYVKGLETRFFRQETLDEAARSVGLSRRQFTAVFREVAGESWLERRLRLRLAHARRLLEQGENSVVAVAFEAGFEDVSNFHRVFKRAYGCTPKACRDGARPGGSR
jgi:AraC family L-rhamnose operon regulatory protein RhaS